MMGDFFQRKWSLVVAIAAVSQSGRAQDYLYEKAPFDYWGGAAENPVTKLGDALARGEQTLPLQDHKALVETLLKAWNISPSSQVLVFSKTSLQRDRITPSTPRALYFNEQTYVGWVPGGMIEIAQMDPTLGPVFYQFDPVRPDRKVPKFDRVESCMSCHASGMTDYLPGLMVRSVFPNARGEPVFQAGTSLIDQQSPLKNRWGGWYVTGQHGDLVHRGNAIATEDKERTTLDTTHTSNLETLDRFFDVQRYLRPTSDILALLVLDHQVGMHQRLTKASYEVRMALLRRQQLMRELGETPGDGLSGSAEVVSRSHVEKILEFLLFCGEAALPEGGIDGSAAFTTAFLSDRKADPDGHSLKDLQRLTRLFKYRCSYLIYSAEWDSLPPVFLQLLYHRLHEILTSPVPLKGYEHLSPSERQTILTILRATKSNLPAEWGKP